MARTPATQAPPTPASYGVHCEIADTDLANAVARFTHDVLGRRALVAAALFRSAAAAD
jgi:hypothetical protein